MAKKNCVKCAEKIQWSATICRHCKSDQPPVDGNEPSSPIAKGCMWVAGAFVALILLVLMLGSNDGAPATSGSTEADCIYKGVAYYKEIGSYPYLQSYPNAGRAVEDVVAERCANSPTAFDL